MNLTKEQIEENNILIARFITDEPEVLEHDLKKAGTVESMHYHNDWSWLMYVIRQIKQMQHDPKEMFMGTTLERKCEFSTVLSFPIYTPIETVWKGVVEFIKWYNSKNKS